MARDPGAFGSSPRLPDEHGAPGVSAVEGVPSTAPGESHPATGSLTTADLAVFLERLPTLDTGVPDAERVDQLGLLEAVKNAAAGAQAAVAVAFAGSQVAVQAARGVPARERGRGVAAQVALARRESPHAGSRHLGLARALHTELVHTSAHLTAGRVSEWTATIVARETAHLAPEQRGAVDAAIAADLPSWNPPRAARQVRALAQRLDPAGAVARAARAEQDRRVTIRPAPDTMAVLTATLPVAQGVACFAALTQAACQEIGAGAAGGRSRSQVMADTLVQRLTGQASASAVPVEIQLVMTDTTLLCSGDEPAQLPGHGPVPAALARELVRGNPDSDSGTPAGPNDSRGDTVPVHSGVADEAAVWVRRLFTSPDGSALVALDSRRRTFTDGLRRFLVARDVTCRTPWCDAPIRDGDHTRPDRAGGATTAANGQGLCQACNQTKEAAGWEHQVIDPGPALPAAGLLGPCRSPGASTAEPGPPGPIEPERRHTVRITTPTGHHYDSSAPRPPGWDPWPQARLRAQPQARPQAQAQHHPPELGLTAPVDSDSALEHHIERLIAA